MTIRLPNQVLKVSLSGIVLESVHLPKTGCAEPECNKVNRGMAVVIQVFQDALRDGYLQEIL